FRKHGYSSTFCSRMYAAGIQPVLIELLMGHAGSGLVHTYAKADDDFKRDAAAKLEAFIAPKSSAENSSTRSKRCELGSNSLKLGRGPLLRRSAKGIVASHAVLSDKSTITLRTGLLGIIAVYRQIRPSAIRFRSRGGILREKS